MKYPTLHSQSGFTLIELLMAMAVFSFMLLIVVAGFINVANLHSEAVASDTVQDNARTAMAELVRAVRDSSGVASISGSVTTNTVRVCLNKAGGTLQSYYVSGGVLTRSDNCVGAPINPQAITTSSANVAFFNTELETYSPVSTAKVEVKFTLRVVSAGAGLTVNTGPTGVTTVCGNSNGQRAYCGVTTLISGAVPR